MTPSSVRAEIAGLKPYVPGLSIAEIQEKYGLAQVIKLASNENPLGTPPLAVAAVRRHAEGAFRYPQGGNPRLAAALGRRHQVDPAQIVVGNGSDEILDLLIRVLAVPGRDNLVCCRPCFSIYPIQGQICGVEARRQPLREDFSFDFDGMLNLVDQHTRLMFVTTPDNPSGYCPPRADVARLARELAARAPQCLLVVDEAYMDFAPDPAGASLLESGELPENAAFMRTFSKQYGLAGLRLGYGVLPARAGGLSLARASAFFCQYPGRRGRPGRSGGQRLLRRHPGSCAHRAGHAHCGAHGSGLYRVVQRGQLPYVPPARRRAAAAVCFEELLRRGVIIRPLTSYGLPDLLRVSVGDARENRVFLNALDDVLTATHGRGGAA